MLRCLFVTLLTVVPSLLCAGDWPQILGPNRDGIAVGETVSTTWGENGPKELWSMDVGNGFAGPAVSNGKLYELHRVNDELVLDCVSAVTGKPVWKISHPCDYRATISYDDGPRCVPTVTASQVITYGPAGQLQSIDIKTGKRQWLLDTHEKYGAQEGYFGAGSSPLVVGDRVIVNVGGSRQDAGMVAFGLKDGRELWTATSETASYSSPVLTKVGKQEVVVAITRMQCIGLDPNTGKTVFKLPFGKRGPTVNAANPVVLGDRLFLTASYDIGAVFGTMTSSGFEELWSSNQILASQYATPIESEGKLFGVHGRQDFGPVELRCLDPAKQKILWSHDLPGYGTMIRADQTLLITTVEGLLIAVAANTKSYRELARAQVQTGTQGGLALPALSNGLLYVRDAKTLRCLDLRKSN